MKLRVLILVSASLLLGGTLYAECVDCWTGPCVVSYSDGSSRTFDEAPYCGAGDALDKGYENCRNVGDCRGCIGWTCVTRDPQTMQQERLLKLVASEVIRVIPASREKN